MRVKLFNNMIGRTFDSVSGKIYGNELELIATDGSKFRFEHDQDCCESVRIEEIIGDLSDLVGPPLLVAEEVSSEYPLGVGESEENPADSYTWTFYRFATINGSITIRFLGESNGYYGETAEYYEELAAQIN
jgi:hypothetical protein